MCCVLGLQHPVSWGREGKRCDVPPYWNPWAQQGGSWRMAAGSICPLGGQPPPPARLLLLQGSPPAQIRCGGPHIITDLDPDVTLALHRRPIPGVVQALVGGPRGGEKPEGKVSGSAVDVALGAFLFTQGQGSCGVWGLCVYQPRGPRGRQGPGPRRLHESTAPKSRAAGSGALHVSTSGNRRGDRPGQAVLSRLQPRPSAAPLQPSALVFAVIYLLSARLAPYKTRRRQSPSPRG